MLNFLLDKSFGKARISNDSTFPIIASATRYALTYSASSFLTVAAKLQGEERERAIALWRRGGKRAFEIEPERKAGD